MGEGILKIGGKYLLWSTISDAPVSYGMTLDELRAHVKEETGRRGLLELERRLMRVEEKGTSFYQDRCVEDTIQFNYAGEDRTCLAIDQIEQHFIKRVGALPRGAEREDDAMGDDI